MRILIRIRLLNRPPNPLQLLQRGLRRRLLGRRLGCHLLEFVALALRGVWVHLLEYLGLFERFWTVACNALMGFIFGFIALHSVAVMESYHSILVTIVNTLFIVLPIPILAIIHGTESQQISVIPYIYISTQSDHFDQPIHPPTPQSLRNELGDAYRRKTSAEHQS